MQTPRISIIVPVYNAEKYLPACLYSILTQTVPAFELLLVDDGSTDRSGAICAEYARTDARVRVFSQKNSGASAARNLGIGNARGEWITFIDSDDWVAQDFLQRMFAAASEQKADAVFCNCFVVKNNRIDEEPVYRQNEVATSAEILRRFLLISGMRSELWGKIFKRKALASLRLDESLRIGEDMLYLIELYHHRSLRTAILTDALYYYRQLPSSVMRTGDIVLHIKKLVAGYLLLVRFHPNIARVNAVEHATFITRCLTFLTKQHALRQFRDPEMMRLLREHAGTAFANLEPNEKRFIRLLNIHPLAAKAGFELNRLKIYFQHKINHHEKR
ncbi:MAG: glycosyltransferase [Dysgonamonadaceae bacterium]|jgi:glycosyltransferase involved in cell wall biosynthesis|nr:glycosyltransferase [Dysgonamonadaceae bacterium]